MAKDEVHLLGFWESPFAITVEWALKFKGIEYKNIDEDFRNKSPILLQYNPVHMKFPILVHDGKPVFESLIIIEYIDETWKENPILPEDSHKKARARFLAKHVEEKCGVSVCNVFCKVGKEEQEKAVKEARENLKFLETDLQGKFFGGEKIGFTDLAAGWIPFWTKIIEEIIGIKLVDEEHMPLLSVWCENVLHDEIMKEILPPWDKALANNTAFREKLASASASAAAST